jgi:hypothetical protein
VTTRTRTRLWRSNAPDNNLDAISPITGVPATINANGSSDSIDVNSVGVLLASVTVGAPAGSTPTLQFYVEVKDALGLWLPVLTMVQLTGASFTYGSVGPGTANVYVLTREARFRWVIGGTGGPSFPNVGVALAGR